VIVNKPKSPRIAPINIAFDKLGVPNKGGL